VVPQWYLTTVGKGVAFSCHPTEASHVRWDFTDTRSTTFVTIFNSERVKQEFDGRFDVTYNNRTSTSVFAVASPTPLDAGFYRCIDATNAKTKMSFELVVLRESVTHD